MPGRGYVNSWMFMDVLPLILPSPKVMDYAQALHVDQGFSFWDAMIVGACFDGGVQTLYSEDLPGRVVEPRLRIVNPFQ